MKQIRRCVFETNSSSSHSIVILKTTSSENKDKYFTTYLSHYNDYLLSPWDSELQFERSPFDILATFKQKLYYAIAYYGKKKFDELNNLAIKYLEDEEGNHLCRGIELPRVRACDWDDKSDIDEEGKIPYYGNVDHQSSELLELMLKKEEMTLEQFLLDPTCIVIIDGDEYYTWEKLEASGIVDTSNIRSEYGLEDTYEEWEATHSEEA